MKAQPQRALIHKVQAYITRLKDGRTQLLVFTHRDYPEAGVQVPAGTVEDGEDLEAALFREIGEETGLDRSRLQMVRKLGVYHYIHPESDRTHERNLYHLVATGNVPDTWEWTETSGGKAPESEWYVFQFHWVGLDEEMDLAGHQGDYLPDLRSGL